MMLGQQPATPLAACLLLRMMRSVMVSDKELTVTVTIEKDPIVSDFRYGDEIIVKNTKMKKLGGKLILLSPK